MLQHVGHILHAQNEKQAALQLRIVVAFRLVLGRGEVVEDVVQDVAIGQLEHADDTGKDLLRHGPDLFVPRHRQAHHVAQNVQSVFRHATGLLKDTAELVLKTGLFDEEQPETQLLRSQPVIELFLYYACKKINQSINQSITVYNTDPPINQSINRSPCVISSLQPHNQSINQSITVYNTDPPINQSINQSPCMISSLQSINQSPCMISSLQPHNQLINQSQCMISRLH